MPFTTVRTAMPRLSPALSATLVATGLLLLVAGGLLYVLFRPHTLLLFRVADGLGLTPAIDHLRQCAAAVRPPGFVVYSLPAGLWATSYVLITAVTAQTLTAKARTAAMALVPAAGAVSELMQAAGLLPGTFDWADLALYLLPLTPAVISSATAEPYTPGGMKAKQTP